MAFNPTKSQDFLFSQWRFPVTSCRGPSSKGSMIIRSHHRGSLALKPVKLRISLVKNPWNLVFFPLLFGSMFGSMFKAVKKTWNNLKITATIYIYINTMLIGGCKYGFIMFYPLIMRVIRYIYINIKLKLGYDAGYGGCAPPCGCEILHHLGSLKPYTLW